jgi:hypothetical protein
MNKIYILIVAILLLTACGNQQTPISEVVGNSPPTVATVGSPTTPTSESATASVESATSTVEITVPLVGEEFVGNVDSITAGSWTIGSHVFIITSGTEIKDSIQVNDQVKVHFVTNADGTYTATELELNN